MGRRTILLIVATLVAALGSTMVFLYVQSVESEVEAKSAPVEVLKAVQQINPGETIEAAQAAGKLQLGPVPRSQVLAGAVNSTETLAGQTALVNIYPNEQVVSGKFGSAGDQELLTLPDGKIAISVTLSDTGRVAGFVSPGDDVAIFLNAPAGADAATPTVRLLLPKVEVVAIGATTVTTTTTTSTEGAQTTEELPKTLFTLAVSQEDAEKILLAVSTGELSFGYMNDKSKVKAGPGVTTSNLFR